MNLAIIKLRQLNDTRLPISERARLRCELAKELEEAGNYEAARHALGDLWPESAPLPLIAELDEINAAEVLLRAGTITGWLGSGNPTSDGQERAKDILWDSRERFGRLGLVVKKCEAQTNLAFCYWRAGGFDEARIAFSDTLAELEVPNTPEAAEQKANTLMSSAIVELSATKLTDALALMDEAAPLVAQIDRAILRGRFHANRAIILKNLTTDDNPSAYSDRALEDFTAATHYFKEAHHTRFRANTENNLGFLFYFLNRFDEAEEHLDRARTLFHGLHDKTHVAQVNETRARVLLAQGRNADAEKLIQPSVNTLERGDRHALLSEALTTQGIARARLRKFAAAEESFSRSVGTAKIAGATELAGLAALSALEEISNALTREEVTRLFTEAQSSLSTSQSQRVLKRLLAVAAALLNGAAASVPASHVQPPSMRFIHSEPSTKELLDQTRHAATTNQPILITGETGVGKDLFARLIHHWSGRSGSLVTINCAALSETLIESQLFGHRKGSFTDAVRDSPGAAKQAMGGTLFLDEIADIGEANQAKLLRLIENHEIMPVGASAPETLDVRIIAATNQHLDRLIAEGRFRTDLYYRLKVVHIVVPPLRERPEDIASLAAHFIRLANECYQKHVTFTPDALAALTHLPLPGNTRELRTLIERTILMSKDPHEIITAASIEITALRCTNAGNTHFSETGWESFDLKIETKNHEDRIIRAALRQSGGHVSHAAKLLGMPHQTLNQRLRTRNKGAADSRIEVQKRGKPTRRLKRSGDSKNISHPLTDERRPLSA